MSTIKKIFLFSRIILRSYYTFFKEMKYFVYNKFFNKVSDEILIKKRAHHIERVLFHENRYTKTYKQQITKELSDLLEKNVHLKEKSYYKWSNKILDEYNNPGNKCVCPLIINNATEKYKYKIKPEELLSFMKDRRSRRIFEQEALTDLEKSMLVEAALYAPSSCNRQTLEFIFIDDLELKKEISATIPGGKQFFHEAPSILVILSFGFDFRYPEDRYTPWIESAAGVQNLSLLAESMGIGCVWGSYTSFGTVSNESYVRKKLQIPDEYVITASLALGKSKQKVCHIPRSESKEKIHTNKFRSI
jgi:nitroreductase